MTRLDWSNTPTKEKAFYEDTTYADEERRALERSLENGDKIINQCVLCKKKFKTDKPNYVICPVCYARRRIDAIERFEERNKLPPMKSSSPDKLLLARLHRMRILGELYGDHKNGDPLALAHYQNFKTFTKVSFWNNYYEKHCKG